MNKVMISVAPVDAASTRNEPKKIAEDVISCWREGASMVHLHVRDANGKLTPDLSGLEETVRYIREATDMVIEVSTGGVSNLSIQERCQPCYASYVEATSLNVGSVNLGEAVYQNPIRDVEYCVSQILQNQKRPEIEVFELGMIHTVKMLDDKFHLIHPILFALVFGHEGEMPATPGALQHMVNYLHEVFPKEEETRWGYTQAHRKDWNMVKLALGMGASSVRIGFEDSDYLSPEQCVDNNAALVRKCVQLVREQNMEPMTASEVRSMMQIGQPIR